MISVITYLKKSKLANLLRKFKYDQDMRAHKANKEKYGYEIIKIIDSLGSELSIELWIEWGTLLGFLREGKLIAHDYDVDFAAYKMSDETYCKLSNRLSEYGFLLIRQFRYKNHIVSETYDYKGTLVDIDYCERDDTGLVYYEYDIGRDTKIEKKNERYNYRLMDLMVYHSVPFQTCRGTFRNGTTCNIPGNAKDHIEHFYGAEWMTPIPDFDWRSLNNYSISKADPDVVGWRSI